MQKAYVPSLKSMTIKILVALTAPFPPPYGGMGVRFEQMAICLEQEGVGIERVQLQHTKSRLLRFFSFLLPAFRIIKLESTIIHAVTGSIPNFIALTPLFFATKISRKKIILSIGGGYWEREGASFTIRSKLVRLLLQLPNVIICCNSELTKAIATLGVNPQQIKSISNALPDEKGTRADESLPRDFLQIRNDTANVLLYVGALKPWYGLIETLEMTAALRERGFECVLVALVKEGGDKDFATAIAEKASDLSLNHFFHLYTSVSWAVSAIAMSDLFIRATNAIEGDSRAVRESLSVGTPVIASDIGHRPDGVTLFTAGDSFSMLNAAISVLNKSGKNEITHIENSEGKMNLHRIVDIYKKLDR